jgi:hypothetical protein
LLIVGSYHTVRVIDIQMYLDRLQVFIDRSTQSIKQFDDNHSTSLINQVSFKHVYHIDESRLQITDLLIYSISNETDRYRLLIGTTSGLYVIREQMPMKLTFPKSMCITGEHVESMHLIDESTHLIAMNILGWDQICCFDLEQSLVQQQLHINVILPNPYRQIPCRMGVHIIHDENDRTGVSFECTLGSDHGSFFFHQIRLGTNTKKVKKLHFDNKRSEMLWTPDKTSISSSLLSASLNEQYLCLTTNNNLIGIYQRK